jgi:hypothetical protein
VANERWDGDERGSGVSDGRAFAPPIRALLDEVERPDWNTEQPEAHLLPHLERWCAREGAPLTLRSTGSEGTVYVVDLEPALGRSRADVHGDVYALISTIAEPTTVVVEREEPGVRLYDVTLAVVPDQTVFPKGHGHLVRFRVPDAA